MFGATARCGRRGATGSLSGTPGRMSMRVLLLKNALLLPFRSQDAVLPCAALHLLVDDGAWDCKEVVDHCFVAAKRLGAGRGHVVARCQNVGGDLAFNL